MPGTNFWECEKIASRAYHPKGNGGVERVNDTMAQMLAMTCNERQDGWDIHLPHVDFAYNNPVSAATGSAANEVHMNRLPRRPLTSSRTALRPRPSAALRTITPTVEGQVGVIHSYGQKHWHQNAGAGRPAATEERLPQYKRDLASSAYQLSSCSSSTHQAPDMTPNLTSSGRKPVNRVERKCGESAYRKRAGLLFSRRRPCFVPADLTRWW